MCSLLHMILPLENYDLSLLDICPAGVTFLFIYFPLKVSETTIPFGLLRLAEQLVPCSVPVNALARLRPFANTAPTTPFKLILPKLCGTPAYPSVKVSFPRDLIESLRLTKEKMGQKKQFSRDPQATAQANTS
ncbi:hypothetical protein B296_00004617 [Ensete ventricosum]|uniref:Uncharacterized protein n=1 Tax=Ensete ventricosum TaxID=4639 RepID=A0A426Y718_ENSVE|nr:hypothetical protein B296_00004617 [Ensete ventricosum]